MISITNQRHYNDTAASVDHLRLLLPLTYLIFASYYNCCWFFQAHGPVPANENNNSNFYYPAMNSRGTDTLSVA